MTKIPTVNFKTMEKLLIRLGFQAVRQKGAMFSIGILTEEQQRFHVIQEKILLDH